MPSAEQPFSFTTERPNFRELGPVCDVTHQFLESLTARYELTIIEDMDFSQVFEDFWRDRITATTRPVAVNPNVFGDETSFGPASPISEGQMATPVITSTALTDQSRSFLFRERVGGGYRASILKGVGIRRLARNPSDVANQFDQQATNLAPDVLEKLGWGSIGGVLEKNVTVELFNGLELCEIYRRMFGQFPSVRLPRRVFDITEALKNEGAPETIRSHYQIEFPLRTPVRASYTEYLSDVGQLFKGLDIAKPDSKDRSEALQRVNFLLSSYPFLNGARDLNYLKMGDIEPVFEALAIYNEVYEADIEGDGEDPLFSRKAGELRYDLAKGGYSLAETFFERNKEAVRAAILNETKELARMVGFASSLGIKLHTSVSSKDAYGRQLADLDATNVRIPGKDEVANLDLDDAIALGLVNCLHLSALMGAPKQWQAEIADVYLKNVSEGFAYTLNNLDKLKLKPEQQQRLREYYSSLGWLVRNRDAIADIEELNRAEKIGLMLLVAQLTSNSQTIKSATGVDLGDHDYTFFLTLPRRPVGQNISWSKKLSEQEDFQVEVASALSEVLDQREEYLRLNITSKPNFVGLKGGRRYQRFTQPQNLT